MRSNAYLFVHPATELPLSQAQRQTSAIVSASKRSTRCLGAILMIAVTCSSARAQDSVLESQFNTSLYKPEAIRLVEAVHGEWLLRCQEIIPLQRRFCNISAPLRSGDGNVRGIMLLTTDKAGKPGVLLKVDLPVAVARPAVVSSAFTVKRDKGAGIAVTYQQSVTPYFCGKTCDYVFPLDNKLVFALNAGQNADVAVFRDAPPAWRKGEIRPEKLTVRGEGFATALTASTARN